LNMAVEIFMLCLTFGIVVAIALDERGKGE
jgi:hypothetical protein